MDLDTLRQSSIGQIIGKLRKHESEAVKTAAAALVKQWKQVVESQQAAAKGAADAGGKKAGGAKPDAGDGAGAAKKAKLSKARALPWQCCGGGGHGAVCQSGCCIAHGVAVGLLVTHIGSPRHQAQFLLCRAGCRAGRDGGT